MHITILTTSFPEYPGDLAGNFVMHLANELSRQALNVQVVAPHSPRTSKHEFLDRVSVDRFQYFYPSNWQRVSYGYGIPANLKTSLLAKIGLLPFLGAFFFCTLRHKRTTDVYHAQWIFSGLVAVLGQGNHKKPIILTVRGSDLNLAQGKLLTSLVKYVFDHVTMITTVSDALRQKVLSLGVSPQKVHTVPNGINCHVFRPLPRAHARSTLHLPSDQKIVLWIGRFVEVKGVEFLIRAIPEIIAKEPDTRFVLVGNGDREKQITTLVQQLGIAHSVIFTGKIPSENIPLWLNAADIFILPSINEGRPNVILEAMACEIPVVATNVGGIPELVKDGKNGCLVPPKNSSKLAACVLDLLRRPSLCLQMGKTGRKMIFEMELSWEQSAKKMKELYQQTVSREQ